MRAFLAGAVWIVIAVELLRRSNRPWTLFPPSQYAVIVFALCAASWLVTGLIVGFIATKYEKCRSWWGIGGTTFVASIVVMFVMGLMAHKMALSPSVPSFKSTDEQMKYFADLATQWVKKDRGIALDYSLDSVKTVEEELTRVSKEVNKANPQKGTFGLAVGYGAYVGEVFRRRDGGTWAVDHPVAGPRSYPLTTGTNGTIFPVGWCWKRLTVGEEDNVYHKALVFSERREVLTNAVPAN